VSSGLLSHDNTGTTGYVVSGEKGDGAERGKDAMVMVKVP